MKKHMYIDPGLSSTDIFINGQFTVWVRGEYSDRIDKIKKLIKENGITSLEINTNGFGTAYEQSLRDLFEQYKLTPDKEDKNLETINELNESISKVDAIINCPKEEVLKLSEAAKKLADITIISIQRFEELLYAEKLLNCLMACGVDNWDGYTDAYDMMEQSE